MQAGRAVKAIAALAVVAAVGALVAVLVAQEARDEREAVAAGAAPARVGPGESPANRRLLRVVAGARFSLELAGCCWERGPIRRLPNAAGFRNGSLLVSKSTVGPQGAEAVVFWTSFPESRYADRCANLLSPPRRASAAELAEAVAAAPGTRLVEGPLSVTVGGYAAEHVVLRVRRDVGCDPGFFYTWRPRGPHGECWGACWLVSSAGDTIRVWIVEVGGTLLFFQAETSQQAGPDVGREIRQIVDSIRFQP